MSGNARAVALSALLEVTQNEGYSNIVIDKAIREAALDPRDAALASALFYGVLEKRMTLDYYIRKCLQKPRQKLDKSVLEILRIAMVQLLYLDKIPESAAVNEAVSLAAKISGGRYKGFVNGVLRGFLRTRDTIPAPERRDVRANIPEAILALWEKDYGSEICEKLIAAFSERAETFLRVNTLKTTASALAETLSAEPVPAVEGALRLSRAGDLTQTAAFQSGLFHVQDLSSQILCALMNPKPGEQIADVCAAPGGKSFTLAERMEDTGRLDAYDLHDIRVGLMRGGAKRLGLTCVYTGVRDAAIGPCERQYDRVLCDAPCSGLGVMRRKPEIRYKKPESFKTLPAVQLEILSHSAAMVKAGGLLFYSTCTLNRAENDAVAETFLAAHADFAPYALENLPYPRAFEEPAHMLTMMPYVHGGDGFFVAAFQKKA